MRFRTVLAVTVFVALELVPLPAGATHKCDKEEPRCFDRRTLVHKPGRQEVISRVMGHHCYHDIDAGDPNHDKRELLSRIGVVFHDVNRESGHLESVTLYFEGRERQIMGAVSGFGHKGKPDFHRYDDKFYGPGQQTTVRVDRRVRFNQRTGSKDLTVYNIRHDAAASRAGGSGPGGNPSGPDRAGLEADCYGTEYLILEVYPPSAPPCRERGRPCPPQ